MSNPSPNPYQAPLTAPEPPAKPGKPPKGPIPGWAWAFAVACGILPVISLGGAIPGALGLGCAAACIELARKPSTSVGRRVFYCAGVTALCWGLFIAFVIAVALLNA